MRFLAVLIGVSGFPVPTALAAVMLGCGGAGTDPGFTLSCDSAPVTTLSGGEHIVVDPLRYRSWNLAAAFSQLGLGPYPLAQDSTGGAGYRVAGTLRGGSGKYARVVQLANAEAVALGLQTSNTTQLLPRLAVVRLR